MKKNPWLGESLNTITKTKKLLAKVSVRVRSDQYGFFSKAIKPNRGTKILDLGVSSDETLEDTNIFERLYPYRKNLTAATIENPKKFKKLYPDIKTVKIYPYKKLPFKNSEFDVVTAWATLEHVGGYEDQAFFLNEALRVGKKVFLTTPYRGCFYEPHTGLPLVQWLPLSKFRKICKLAGNNFWATEKNLNPLFVRDLNKMKLLKKVKVKVYKMFGVIPSHLLIYV